MDSIFIDWDVFKDRYVPVIDNNDQDLKLGEGTFGEVYLYVNQDTKKPVAIKIMQAYEDDLNYSLIKEEIQ